MVLHGKNQTKIGKYQPSYIQQTFLAIKWLVKDKLLDIFRKKGGINYDKEPVTVLGTSGNKKK